MFRQHSWSRSPTTQEKLLPLFSRATGTETTCTPKAASPCIYGAYRPDGRLTEDVEVGLRGRKLNASLLLKGALWGMCKPLT